MDFGTLALLTLLTAPLVGVAAGRRLRSEPASRTILVAIAAAAAILVTTLTLTTGWSIRGVVPDAAVLFLAYFAFCSAAVAVVLRIRSRALRWVAICMLCILIAAGYLIGTVGSLGVVFVAADYEPRSSGSLARDLSYRTYGFGNATTSHGGTVIQVLHHPRWAPWMERRLLREAFDFREHDLDALKVEVRSHGSMRRIVVREAELDVYASDPF